MAFRLPRRLKLGRIRPLGRRGNFVALAGLGALLVTSTQAQVAQAQVIVGGHGGPSVSVDNSVLDRLGPPLTLPQYFLGEHDPSALNRHVATNQRSTHSAAPSHHATKRHVATRHVTRHKTAIAKAAPSRVAPVRTASTLNQIIHLIPPKSRLASAEPTTTPAATSQVQISPPLVAHQETVSAPTRPTVAALAAPAPTPKQPASSDSPTPPVMPPQQAREEARPAPPTPLSQPVVAAAPPAAPVPVVSAPAPVASVVTASTKSALPSMTVTPNTGSAPYVPFSTVAATTPVPATTVAAAAPPPVTVTPNGPAATIAAPPVQMAAATTVGDAASALKFKAGATDLGSGAQPVLDALASRLLANETLRIQIISHATGGADDAMEARRVSLARAVAVRAYLIEKGVRSLRIDVRALGNRVDNGLAADQVDLLVVSQ